VLKAKEEVKKTPTDPTLRKIYSIAEKDLSEYASHLMVGGGTRGGPVLHHGEGIKVWDIEGREYIDCTSQSWALYLGHCNAELWSAVDEQARMLTHVHQGFDTLPRFYLAKKMAEILPGPINRVSFVPSSGLALEGAMKLAIKNRPGSNYFVSLWDGYHGTTLGTMGGSWISTRSNGKYIGGSRFLPLTLPFVRVPNPNCYRCPFHQQEATCDLMCAQMLDLTLQKGVNGPAAGLIIEPLQASGGMIPCPKKYLERVRSICDRYQVPLIFDEIQTYIRIGQFTAAEYYGVCPDMIAFGKAIGGGLPMGITALRDGLEGFSPDAEELHTFAANTLSMVGAIKLIEIVERDGLLAHTRHMGEYFRKRLQDLQKDFPEIGDIRQAGLHIGIDLVQDPGTKEPLNDKTPMIRDEAMRRGVIFGLAGVMKNLLKIKPPLIIQEPEADQVLEILQQSLKTVLRK
jgi:4-aminobutyrate aminotransferase-like enzyme